MSDEITERFRIARSDHRELEKRVRSLEIKVAHVAGWAAAASAGGSVAAAALLELLR